MYVWGGGDADWGGGGGAVGGTGVGIPIGEQLWSGRSRGWLGGGRGILDWRCDGCFVKVWVLYLYRL